MVEQAEQKKVTEQELKVLQALHTELQMVQAKMQGALSVLAAVHQIPDGGSIDPVTGVITHPARKTEAE